MDKPNNRIVFILPEETNVADIIDEILKNNGLEESDEEFFDKEMENKEPRAIIIRDAALAMVEKKIPQENLIDLLSKHLETERVRAEKIAKEIDQQIIPFAKIVTSTEQQQELIQKIKAGMGAVKSESKNELPRPYPKLAPIIDVEKNAENMMAEGKNITTQEKNKFSKEFTENELTPTNEPKETDTYREPIE